VISACASALLVSCPTRNNNNNERVGDGRQDRHGNDGQIFGQPASADGYLRPVGDYAGRFPGFGRAMCCRAVGTGAGSALEVQWAVKIIGDGECEQ
jgi:hypothetical protein